MNRTVLIIVSLWLVACTQSEQSKDQTIFQSIDPELSGVTFANRLQVSEDRNFFKYGNYYMGGGVAIGDVNNDGLQDLYFTGNDVPNKLYLNLGDFKFKDISDISGTATADRWVMGAAFADVNADGKLDLYLSVAGKWDTTENQLFINQGNDADGTPIFKEEAKGRGVADAGMSYQTCFFDYDQDGDIDMYVSNYESVSFSTTIEQYQAKVDHPQWETSDHLYANDGNGFFTDQTVAAGMLSYGLTLGLLANDFNNDGLTDLYVSNDINTPDLFYINNGDGTFTNRLEETMQHTAFYGMGIDAADINHDGIMDIVQLDMTPADNFRSKASMGSMDIEGFWKNVAAGFHFQYMYNALQLAQGIRPDGLPFYSDVAKINKVDKTDWSWAPLFADFDNDGYDDLFVTNGTRRDVNNKDFFNWLGRTDIQMKVRFKDLTFQQLTDKMPSKKMDNYVFRNKDGQQFEKSNDDWGLHFEGFSNGAAYVDLDNDGDLEIVTNNIDSAASIFRNWSVEKNRGHYLKVSLKGPDQNPWALNAKVSVYADGQIMTKEQTMVRGYISSVDPVLHFGVGQAVQLDSVVVTWPSGRQSSLRQVATNQTLQMAYTQAQEVAPAPTKSKAPIFKSIERNGLSQTVLNENDFDDFKHQILLPHRMSRLGPALAVADINQDQKDDVYIGGAMGIAPQLWIQQADGTFAQQAFPESAAAHEDVQATFFDADRDGDMDLYVVSGGNDAKLNDGRYQDRLYINDQGQFTLSTALPRFTVSGGVVLPLDYDNDGDWDLFIGGRQMPRRYPLPASSYLLENRTDGANVVFEVSKQEAFEGLGMVTSAAWIDLNADNAPELVVAGEWMPITVFERENGQFVNHTASYGLDQTVGWWNTIQTADFDGDGDQDLLVGNLGQNYKYQASPDQTFDIYASDYDENGKTDIVLGFYENENQYPVRGMQCSSDQMPEIKKKFKNKYNAFAQATLADIYSDQALSNSIHYRAQTFASVYIENQGNGSVTVTKLPFQAQISSINDFAVKDFNQDGHLDFVAVGNQFHSEIETPRNDASFGGLFLGDSQGHFKYAPYEKSGLYLPYDMRAVRILSDTSSQLIVVSNEGPVSLYEF